MDLPLSDLEVRVLGALIEKEITTPDYYPLSLNALTNACNQKSNRYPVMALDEGAAREALDSLSRKWLAGPSSTAESRVTKFGHRAQEVFNFDRRETAILCELMLRGPQTLGELRAHAERMYRFDDLETLESTLLKLSERQPPLVKKLPRLPGTKEPRYAQLLAGEKAEWTTFAEPAALAAAPPSDDRIPHLEAEVAELRQRLNDLQQQFAQFKKQFE
ncbi:MAG: YceH family protein [Terriglobia bacterium]